MKAAPTLITFAQGIFIVKKMGKRHKKIQISD
jgi:hypothetical protein